MPHGWLSYTKAVTSGIRAWLRGRRLSNIVTMSSVEDHNVEGELGRGRDGQTNTKSKRSKDKSVDIVAAMEARLTRVELAMADTQERVDVLEGCEEELKGRVDEHDLSLRNTTAQPQGELDAFKAQVLEMMANLQACVDEVRAEVTLCKKAIIGGATTSREAPKVDVPKPMSYDGQRDAREVDNFLWHMEQYFKAISLEDEQMKVQTAILYLKDTATLWWRRRHGDIERGTCTIDTWDSFKRELKKQFYPENAAFLARRNLKRLKQTGSIRDYVKAFSTLMLDIQDMTEVDLLFNFMDGLQGWAAQELQRRGVQDISSAIAAAESIVEYRREDPSKPKKPYSEKGGGASTSKETYPKESIEKTSSYRENKARDDRRSGYRRKTACFLCDGPHWASQCPKKKALTAMHEEGDEEGEAHIGSLQLAAIKAKTKEVKATSSQKGLMYVEVHINNKPTCAMVDTGATHNFVSTEEAKKLGLKVSKETGWLKTVNSQARPIHGVARGVEMHIGTWKGTIDLSVVPMDDFQVVLGMDFLRKVNAIAMPSISMICIMEDRASCMVPTIPKTKDCPKLLSTMQLEDRARKREEERSKEVLHKPTKKVFDKFKGIMPSDLTKKLPPRNEVTNQERFKVAKSYLDKVTKKIKRWASKRRRPAKFIVGDSVLVRLTRKEHRYEGPFEIVRKVGKMSYEVNLPPKFKTHPVFHARTLKLYHRDMGNPSHGTSTQAPTRVLTPYDREAECVKTEKVIRRQGVPPCRGYVVK